MIAAAAVVIVGISLMAILDRRMERARREAVQALEESIAALEDSERRYNQAAEYNLATRRMITKLESK